MSGTEAHITERRTVDMGAVKWTVNEFNHGQSYMLVATASHSSVQFSVHFTAEEWAEFQKLVSP